MRSGGAISKKDPVGFWAPRLLLVLCFLAGEAWAGDIVRLRGGREVEGKILSITADVITLQVGGGILRLPREQVLSIHMEQTQVALPAPLAAAGRSGQGSLGLEPGSAAEPEVPVRDPEPGEEGWKAPLPSGSEHPGEKQTVPPTPGGAAPAREPPATEVCATTFPRAEDPDDRIHSFLSRYLWLVPAAPSHRIGLGAGLLFLATLVFFLAGKLADVEGATFTRSFFLAGLFIGLCVLQVALFAASGWSVLAGIGSLNLLVWYGIARCLLAASLWKATVMLASACFATLLGVLWIEVMGYLLLLS